MPSNEKQYNVSEVNYVDRDFTSLKRALIDYAKAYFPTTYQDFNESSPGMMLIEMSAYVGDVLNFYIDQQYQEMLLPLAEERRNVINIAKMLGYKTKPTIPAYAEIVFSQTVDADATDTLNVSPNWNQAMTIDKNLVITSNKDSNIKFQTLAPVDFKVSSSADPDPVVISTDGNTGLPSSYEITRTMRAISAETKTHQISVGSSKKFLKVNLPDTNVIDVVKVKDSNNNIWYQVDYLAQDKVSIETHYSKDDERLITGQTVPSAYASFPDEDGTVTVESIAVPYSLEYIKTSKRFVTEVDENGNTSLIFGSGVLRSGQANLEDAFFQSEIGGVVSPSGNSSGVDIPIDPRSGDSSTTLGEIPTQTTLTITYRVGGGYSSNVPVNDLTSIGSLTLMNGTSNNGTLRCSNELPAAGGAARESIDEIRERSKAFFATQNRCVTKEDYEARTLAMDSRFGSLAKVYVQRAESGDYSLQSGQGTYAQYLNNVTTALNTILGRISSATQYIPSDADVNDDGVIDELDVEELAISSDSFINGSLENETLIDVSGINFDFNMDGTVDFAEGIPSMVTPSQLLQLDEATGVLPSINITTLSYNHNKNLIGDPHGVGKTTPLLLHQNLKNYLSEFRVISDTVNIMDGYIINFGVFFDVVANKFADKKEVKLKCIEVIKQFFNVDKFQFKQPIYSTDVEFELMNVEGVRNVNYVCLSQFTNFLDGNGDSFDFPLFDVVMSSGFAEPRDALSTNNYGYQYDFSQFYNTVSGPAVAGNGVILPSASPAVFELKDPNRNIKGVVR